MLPHASFRRAIHLNHLGLIVTMKGGVSSMTSATSFRIERITLDLYEKVTAHMRQCFCRDEPLNDCSAVVDAEHKSCPDLEKYTLQDIEDGVSLAAITPEGEVVALCMNAIRVKGEEETKEETECGDKKFSEIKRLLTYVHKSANILGQFSDVQKAMEINVISVDAKWRGKGLAKQLVERTENLARETGCSLIFVLCTSEFTARAAQRLGFELFYALDYQDWKKDGKPIFTPAPPHTRATVYVKRISPK